MSKRFSSINESGFLNLLDLSVAKEFATNPLDFPYKISAIDESVKSPLIDLIFWINFSRNIFDINLKESISEKPI